MSSLLAGIPSSRNGLNYLVPTKWYQPFITSGGPISPPKTNKSPP